MANVDVTLPDLAEASGDDDAGDTAKVSFIYLDEGDDVSEGDDLVELVTDKATFNVPSPASGEITSVLIEEDDEVTVGQKLFTIDGSD